LSAAAFVSAARGLLGARWRHRGRKPWAVDCIGLLVLAGRDAGMAAPDEKRYGREAWEDRLTAGLRERFGAPVAAMRAGDIAVIRWGAGEPTHVGILADHPDGGLSIIHAHNLHGVIEHALRGEILNCVVEVYRPFPGDA